MHMRVVRRDNQNVAHRHVALITVLVDPATTNDSLMTAGDRGRFLIR